MFKEPTTIMATEAGTRETGAWTVDLIECVNFAAIKHRQQRRKDHDATPYINHPIGT